MKQNRLYSFIIKSDFGMFKKPDINDKIFITYNIIPRTYVLGILGAIMGYKGHAQNVDSSKMPEYYEKLKDIRMAIAPKADNCGILRKEFIIYNNTVNGSISNINEQTLIEPKFEIFLELDEIKHKILIERLESNQSEYLAYMGKNEFSLYWDSFHTHKKFEQICEKEKFKVETIIPKDEKFILKNSGYKERTTNYFYLFERLPLDWNISPRQYKYQDFLYTNSVFKSSKMFKTINELGELYECDKGVICLLKASMN